MQELFIDDSPDFFQLLDQFDDLEQFVPQCFFNAFYQKLGRKWVYPLSGFLSALILQKVLSIPSVPLLILFLSLCKELRDFCGFSMVPDAPLFTRFKQEFLPHIEMMFQIMDDYTEPLCQAIDASLAQMLTFDTSGIELYVTENNPKTLNSLIEDSRCIYRQLRPHCTPVLSSCAAQKVHACRSVEHPVSRKEMWPFPEGSAVTIDYYSGGTFNPAFLRISSKRSILSRRCWISIQFPCDSSSASSKDQSAI